MERAQAASWRLTFVAWSALLVVWGVVTIALDYDTLLVVRRLAGERPDGAAAALGLVIGLPLLIDVTRNLQRSYRLWRRRTIHDSARASWSTAVPASTPRIFRLPDGVELTRRERTIVEQGQLAYGRVEHHGELVGVRYRAPWGVDIASRPVVLEQSPREGARAAILFEQGARVGVAPTLHALEFFAAEPEDRRTMASPGNKPRSASLSTVSLHATVHPVERAAGSFRAEVGELSFDGERLTVLHERLEPISLRLDQPLRVELSVFLLPAGVAELNVSIESRQGGAYRAGEAQRLRFKTELPQRRLDASIERRWMDACYLSSADFDALWALLLDAADDSSLRRKVGA